MRYSILHTNVCSVRGNSIVGERFTSHQSILDFTGYFLLVCPRCSQCARVQRLGERVALTCRSCGYSREDSKPRCAIAFAPNGAAFGPDTVGVGAPVDSYFYQPLWLQVSYCGEVLWAYNEEHLAFLEAFVLAKQRTSVRSEHGWSNQSLMNRLPLWMKQAKNRDEVLRCLEKLRQKLYQSQQSSSSL
jgi:hypothetical protein